MAGNHRQTDYLRSALQATFADSVSAPLPDDMMELLRAFDAPEAQPLRTSKWRPRFSMR